MTVPQLLSILQNKEMMSADNLVLDPNAPLAMFQPNDGRLGEALSGSVYQRLYSDLVTNPSKQFLCPLIIYTDAAAVDSLFRFLVEPLVFTVAVLSQDARSKANAWRPLGYVQQLKSSLRSDEHILSGDAKSRNYHAQLSAMLETLRLAQSPMASTLKNVKIYLFGKVITVDILCPILFISADTPAADKLCGHFSSYNSGVKQITCSCDVPFIKLDDPNFGCTPVTWDAVNDIVMNGTKEQQAAVSQHQCHNAFTGLVIGDPAYKIFGSVPTDIMHVVRLSLMAKALKIIFSCLTPQQRHKLDELARQFHKTHRQSCQKTFPQTNFSSGITKLSNITASEHCGLIFLLVCLAQFELGWNILDEGLVTSSHKTDLRKVLQALEALSCFDAWTRMDKYWRFTEQEEFSVEAKQSMAKLLCMLRDSLPRTDGNGWKLPTFHNTMHIVSDMCKYGKPKEYHTEVGEKNHKLFAKRIGHRCHKHHKTFATQVAQCLADTFVIHKLASAMGLLKVDEDGSNSNNNMNAGEASEPENMKGATHFRLQLNAKNKLNVTWQSVMETHLLTCKNDLCDFLQSYFLSSMNNVSINCCTEYTYNDLYMRCHPCYKGEGPWYDWVNVYFEESKIDGKVFPEGNYPCKVMTILPQQRNEFLEETLVVVQSSHSRTRKGSVLFTQWSLMDGYIVVPISSIVETVFVLELGGNKIAVALPYSEWPSMFTNTSY